VFLPCVYLKHSFTCIVLVCRVTEILVGMGYSRAEIEESLSQAKYDDIFATYLLLGRKSNDVSIYVIILE